MPVSSVVKASPQGLAFKLLWSFFAVLFWEIQGVRLF
jgi:hypothetical protein